MAGIEKITNEINADAEREAAEIISTAEESAKKLIDKTREECDAYMAAAGERTDKRLADEAKKTASQCEQAEKLIILEAKQDIIEDILRKAKAKLLIQDTSEYFETLATLLQSQVQPDKGELLLSDKDLGRMPADFKSRVQSIATKHGGMLDISQETVDIDGGFILRYGNIEINSSFDALFDENRERLLDVVNDILWQGDNK